MEIYEVISNITYNRKYFLFIIIDKYREKSFYFFDICRWGILVCVLIKKTYNMTNYDRLKFWHLYQI